ncbi:hypothetical protein EVAR_41003_1 [Eumeta japonica]|uniref:Uncharacterized protein n=1 Tax=Eumeta variegata TaxID=151549 RepID=A0A4C1XII8_EUMVA|nr:hypothetical protein EVAR_41003_1 [Eumeta japonica]
MYTIPETRNLPSHSQAHSARFLVGRVKLERICPLRAAPTRAKECGRTSRGFFRIRSATRRLRETARENRILDELTLPMDTLAKAFATKQLRSFENTQGYLPFAREFRNVVSRISNSRLWRLHVHYVTFRHLFAYKTQLSRRRHVP